MSTSAELTNCLQVLRDADASLDASLASLLLLPRLLQTESTGSKAVREAWLALRPNFLDQLLRTDRQASIEGEEGMRTVAIHVLSTFARLLPEAVKSKKMAERVPYLLKPSLISASEEEMDDTIQLLLALCTSDMTLRRLSRPSSLDFLFDLRKARPERAERVDGIVMTCLSRLSDQMADRDKEEEEGGEGEKERGTAFYAIARAIRVTLSRYIRIFMESREDEACRSEILRILCTLIPQLYRPLMDEAMEAKGEEQGPNRDMQEGILTILSDTLGSKQDPKVRDAALELAYLTFRYYGMDLFLGRLCDRSIKPSSPNTDKGKQRSKGKMREGGMEEGRGDGSGRIHSSTVINNWEGQERLAGLLVQLASLETRVGLDHLVLSHRKGQKGMEEEEGNRPLKMSRVGLGLLDEMMECWTLASEEEEEEDRVGILGMPMFLKAWKAMEGAMEATIEFLKDVAEEPMLTSPQGGGVGIQPVLIPALTVMSHWSTGKEELSKMRADLLPLFLPLLRLPREEENGKGEGVMEALCDPLGYLLEDTFLTQDARELGLTRILEEYLEELWSVKGVREEGRLARWARMVLQAGGALPTPIEQYLMERDWELPGLEEGQ